MTAMRRRSMLAAARKAAGHTQESLAGALYVDRKTVIRWEAGDSAPWPYLWPKLARMLGITSERLQVLFEQGADGAEPVLTDDLEAACNWLDRRTGWSTGTSRRKVTAHIARQDSCGLRKRHARRAAIGRSQVVRELTDYYGDLASGLAIYSGEYASRRIATSILTCPEWLDLRRPLARSGHRLTIADPVPRWRAPTLASTASRAAVERLAEASVLDVRLTDARIYRLLDIQAQSGVLSGSVDLLPFTEYALTADLLEAELLDAIAKGTVAQPGNLPLRDRYLPDLRAVLDLRGRACVGGALALCAIARPVGAHRSKPDYALLIQKRSDRVLNAPGRLAVIPKGFHRPLTDYRAEADFAVTLRRELEEELFGRTDLDNTLGEIRAADPMHPARQSEPMRWLTESNALRMECTGFGLNLVSGNYEFACLIVIENEEFWRLYGGNIEANWEATGLRPYSSVDRSAITELVADESWSNEGLFALLQGLRRLAQISDRRLNTIDMETG